jgi:hypothetical protein
MRDGLRPSSRGDAEEGYADMGEVVMQGQRALHHETELDLVLTAIGVVAAFVPILGLLLAPLGVVSLAAWFRVAALPAAGILVLVALYGLARNNVLLNRIVAGFLASLLASIGLDVVRLFGVAIGVLPDIPMGVGAMVAGMPMHGPPPFGVLPWASGMPAGIIALGFLYHLVLNGGLWGAGYALALGRTPVWVGVAWGLLLELIMMVSPPFMMMGFTPFGFNHGPWPFLVTLVAHVVYGVLFGVLQHRWVVDESGPEGIRAVWPDWRGLPWEERPAL